MNVFLIFAAAAAVQFSGLVRHYLFDEGTGDEVVNHVRIEPGRRAETGGPLGSLSICRTTYYGMDSVESYKIRDTNTIESVWCRGRLPGKAALRVGTHDVGLYKSGITGNEFTNGFTIAGWIKFEADENVRYAGCNAFALRGKETYLYQHTSARVARTLRRRL